MRHFGFGSFLCLAFGCLAAATEYYVAPAGSDSNSGSKTRPFRTIRRAAAAVGPGDVCYVRSGCYRETVRPAKGGAPGRPVRFAAYHGELVTLSGAETLRGAWSLYKGRIYRTKIGISFDQLFLDAKMLMEARWPNMQADQIWDRTRWTAAGKGSRYGRIVDPELARTGVDWTGALATLN